MRWYEKIILAHTEVTSEVSHYERLKSWRYFVWQEDDRQDLLAESEHKERVYTGTTDLFTKNEFDPWAEQLEAAMTKHGIAWSRISTQYEPDTGVIHIEWAWEVTDGKDIS